MTIEQYRKLGIYFHHAKFDILENMEDFERHLFGFLMSGAYFNENDEIIEARHLVEKIGKLKIEIYAKEHAPPHFHITNGLQKASLRIEDCEVLENSGFNQREIKNISDWFKRSKMKLIDVWNKTRPTDCVVGKIV